MRQIKIPQLRESNTTEVRKHCITRTVADSERRDAMTQMTQESLDCVSAGSFSHYCIDGYHHIVGIVCTRIECGSDGTAYSSAGVARDQNNHVLFFLKKE
jgi:hypothetical protein